ncbi:RHS repeat-associated core domain-containing protein [Kocuria sp. KH4]
MSSEAWGWNEGKFSVSGDGSAEYSLPLWTPEGRGGLQPELSLAYNSRSGNGILGVGWSLTGISSKITPCPRTIAQDGVREGIRYDGSDVYCLDGNRLRPTGEGTASQQEFRTENSTFARIIAYGPKGTVPSSFAAWTKDGRKLEFGKPQWASRLQAGPSHTNPSLERHRDGVAVAWTVSRIRDRRNNVLTIDWRQLPGGPSDLWYNDLQPEAIHYQPNQTVRFNYEDRPDPIDGFEQGAHTRTTVRLSKIEMFAGEGATEPQMLREYRLKYSNDSITGRSLLRSVTECDHEGVCKNPLLFKWKTGSHEFSEISSNVSDAATYSSTAGRLDVADINADGLDDLLYPSVDNRWMGRLGKGSGYFEEPRQIWGGIRPGYKQDARPIDFDRDGRTDLMLEIPDPYCDCGGIGGVELPTEYALFQSKSDSVPRFDLYQPDVDEEHTSVWAFRERDPAYFLDLDGNGLPDYATPRSTVHEAPWRYRLNTGDNGAGRFGPMVHTEHKSNTAVEAAPFVRVLDSDGDGRDEFLQLRGDIGSRPEYETFGIDSNGDVERFDINIPTTATSGFGTDLHLADLNGDGLKDVVYPFDGLRVQLNSGNGFGPFMPGPAQYLEPTPQVTPEFNVGVRIADFTNDGSDDVLIFHHGVPRGHTDYEHGVQLYTWRGDQFVRTGLNREAVQLQGFGFSATDVLDVDGDGALDIIHLADGDPDYLKVLRRQGGVPDQLASIDVGGVGPRVTIDYTTLANDKIHKPGRCEYPLNCPVRGGSIVRSHRLWNGTDWNFFRHEYKEARVDLSGRGWLGFAEHMVFDERAQTTTVTSFDNVSHSDAAGPVVYPYANLPKTTKVSLKPDADTKYLRSTHHTYALRSLPVAGTYTVEHRATEEIEQEAPAGTAPWTTVRSLKTEREYDSYGNQTINQVSHAGGRTITQETNYQIDEANWLVSRPWRQDTIACIPNASDGTDCTIREVTFDHYPNGDLKETVVDPLDPAQQLSTVLGRDDYGNITSETVSDAAGNQRVTTYSYDADSFRPTSIGKELGDGMPAHVTRMTVHPGLGVPLSTTDPNGVTTTMKYDWFGRIRETNRADGSFEKTSYDFDHNPHMIAQTSSDGRVTFTYLDTLGREHRKMVTGFKGSWATTDTSYDKLGRITSVSRPALPSEPTVFTTFDYDQLGRVIRKTDPDGVSVRTDYVGLETHTYDGKNVHSYTVTDNNGDLESSYEDDPLSTDWLRTQYDYGPFGELTKVTAPDETTQTMTYDTLGRHTGQTDPSAGTSVSTYNAFGDLETHTDGSGSTTEYAYDALGRVKTLTSPDGTAIYTWDTAPHGLGKLASSRSTDNVSTDYTYDDETGKNATTTWTIDGTQYQLKYGYDTIGRLACLNYPEIPGNAGRLSVGYFYNHYGFLDRVTDGCEIGGQPYWEAEAVNGAEQLERERFGNEVVTTRTYRPKTGLLDRIQASGPGTVGQLIDVAYDYDANRNVITRNDQANERAEFYHYDSLNRLDEWTVQPDPGPRSMSATFAYDTAGNLQTETVQAANEPEKTTTYQYGQDGAPPHALTSANGHKYGYDDAGRQITGPQRTMEYNRTGLPRVLTQAQGGRTEYAYDADGARVSKRDSTQTVLSVPGFFERQMPASTGSGEVHNIHHVVVEGRTVAQIDRVQTASHGPVTDSRMSYLHTDRQNSTTLTSRPNGQRADVYYYHPFGQRVDETGTALENARAHGPRIGYTGHEHDDEDGLIYMKGRMYDPAARRFLAPDPIVANPLLSQSLNRYSYVQNNPATLTDPTGLQSFNPFEQLESMWNAVHENLQEQQEQQSLPSRNPTAPSDLAPAPEMDDDAQISGPEAMPAATSKGGTNLKSADDQTSQRSPWWDPDESKKDENKVEWKITDEGLALQAGVVARSAKWITGSSGDKKPVSNSADTKTRASLEFSFLKREMSLVAGSSGVQAGAVFKVAEGELCGFACTPFPVYQACVEVCGDYGWGVGGSVGLLEGTGNMKLYLGWGGGVSAKPSLNRNKWEERDFGRSLLNWLTKSSVGNIF